MRHIISLSIVAFISLILFYASRFWIFSWWDRPGLFELKQLPPQGGVLQRWLRGTDFSPYELIIWVIACFLILTFLEKIFDKFKKPDSGEH